jgi:hypothetical protein
VLIDCVDDYGESIASLFGLPSLVLFLAQIDKISKEKGIQIIEHFLHNTSLLKIEKLVANSERNCPSLNDSVRLSQE